ncbi:exodeoxyribonuclease V subunit gamma [Denitratisoma oestradiolicum]|uniref:RecBCD enzyme subunit RecC n=1 Tax=Denitratisoma oestradiolicum TaxID=311182 RepID=A0A6S6Y8M4_9PROT|nr:exodeoxyribonuclease V subunit gamma [Denitratisoma oestradiolicum]CAB1368838.1 RecBCD enzyme subunit RecC [Denitratisoma oestradiolicum]
MFTLIHGNRQEVLARRLAQGLRADPPGLFQEEVVVVQSEAMARWLKLYLAEELGIAAQLRFPFPAGYLWELFGRVLPAVPRSSPFAAGRLHWRLLRMLAQPREEEVFAPLGHYLAGNDPLRRDGLARKLAAVFETYLAYRPDWLADWSAGRHRGLGPHEAWQARLWQELLAELPDLPEAHPRQAFLAALAAEPARAARLPRRISLFGIGAMAPPHFEVFRDLGRHLDVTLYLLNPCREYWGDIVARRVQALAALAQPEAAIHLETGHGLLGSLGTVARQFFDQASDAALMEEAFTEPDGQGASTLLQRLQADMLDLREPAAPGAMPVDGSLQIHVCHGPMREVEVLHDRLLALFEADPGLRPSDVLVLAPDIEAYAPLVEAQFATQLPGRRIPFTIADRPPAAHAPLQRSFAALLDLAGGRLEVAAVLGFIEQPPVMAHLGLDEARLEQVRDWVRAAGIRWGVDADWRAAEGLPASDEHSWRAGFERLLLGVALPADGELFRGLLPAADIEGSGVAVLGRLIDFGEALFQAHRELNRSRSLAEWSLYLAGLLPRFFDVEQDPRDTIAAQELRSALEALAVEADAADCQELMPLAVLRRALDEALESTAPGWAFCGGGVTFAALRAHRAVPCKVLCLLGLNDGEFPRNPALPGFDLVAAHPRAGDRSARDEDRHAFLEALLSVRQVLHISYLGRSIRDNSELPPSTLVSELLDSIARGYGDPAAITVVHPLQAFSRRYFDGSGPASYAEEYAAASRAAAARRQDDRAGRPFLAAPLPPGPEAMAETSLDGLIRLLQNPARHLLRGRLGIHLEAGEGLVNSAEPFVLDGLERYGLDQLILDRHAMGEASVHALARARGDLPHGGAGESIFRARWSALAPLARRVEEVRAGMLPPQPVDLAFAGIALTGQLTQLSADGLVAWRPGRTRNKDLLALWVRHLILHLATPADIQPRSRLLCLDGSTTLGPVADADAQLSVLLQLAQRAGNELLPFFPETSGAFVKDSAANWQGQWFSDFNPELTEHTDPYFDLAFAGCDPFGDEFQALARQVFEPLFAALEKTA